MQAAITSGPPSPRLWWMAGPLWSCCWCPHCVAAASLGWQCPHRTHLGAHNPSWCTILPTPTLPDQLGGLPPRAALPHCRRHTQRRGIDINNDGDNRNINNNSCHRDSPPPDSLESSLCGGQLWWFVPLHCQKVPEMYNDFLSQGENVCCGDYGGDAAYCNGMCCLL
jgi:hypothetical protein